MSGITDQKNLRGDVVRLTLDGNQMLRFNLEEIFDQPLFPYQWNGVGKESVEEREQILVGLDVAEVLERHEKRHRPSAILVGQRDHHKLATWPNVEKIVRHLELK